MTVEIPTGHALITFNMRARAALRPMAFTLGVRGDFVDQVPGDIAAFEEAMVGEFNLFHEDSMSSDYSYLGATATIGTDTGPIAWSRTRNIAGLANIVPPPPNTSILVRKTSNRGGKRGRGRMFLPPAWVGEGSIDHLGFWTASGSLLESYLDLMIDNLAANDLQPMLLHAPSKVNPAAPVPPPTVITGFVLTSQVATQRKRLR